MRRADLLALLAENDESSFVEFKRDDITPRDLAAELVALTNHRGGRVLLGVERDRSVSGLTRPATDVEEWVMEAARSKIRPELIPSFEVVRDVEPGRDVGVVTVEEGYTVHAVWHHQHSTYYVRVGSTNREASREELERLLQRRGSLRAELRPLSGATLDDLDLRRLREYLAVRRGQEVPGQGAREGWERLLVNTELMAEDRDVPRPTVASMLLFGVRPARFLPQHGITAVDFPGTEKDYDYRARARLQAPLTPLAVGGLEEPGLVGQALAFVRRALPLEVALDAQGRRTERAVYPDDVLREVVANAVVHRDYLLSGTDVELAVYADRLEVISPGRLPHGITPERMRAGTRSARNQLLKDVLQDYGLVDHLGLGVPRRIIAGMRAHNGTEVELIEQDDERFLVRLHARA